MANQNDAPAAPDNQLVDIFAIKINLAAALGCMLAVFIGVKLTSLLPEKLYFSFSKVVTEDQQSPFLIQPPHLREDQVCDALKQEKGIKSLQCQTEDEQSSQQPNDQSEQSNIGASEEDFKKERKLADKAIRLTANQNYLYSLLGFLIRLAIPLGAGIVIGRFFSTEGFLAAAIGGGLAAFILCWPVIALWNTAVSEDWRDLRKEFIALYILYILLFAFAARLGAFLGAGFGTKRISLQINKTKIIESVAGSIISAIGIKILEQVILS
jgi:hypothetical protein